MKEVVKNKDYAGTWNIILLQHIHNKETMHEMCFSLLFCKDKEQRGRLTICCSCGEWMSKREWYPESLADYNYKKRWSINAGVRSWWCVSCKDWKLLLLSGSGAEAAGRANAEGRGPEHRKKTVMKAQMIWTKLKPNIPHYYLWGFKTL